MRAELNRQNLKNYVSQVTDRSMCMLEVCVHVQTHKHETDIFIDLYFLTIILSRYLDIAWKCLLFTYLISHFKFHFTQLCMTLFLTM